MKINENQSKSIKNQSKSIKINLKSILNQLKSIKIKKISYTDPLLSFNNTSKNNNFFRVKERYSAEFFSF